MTIDSEVVKTIIELLDDDQLRIHAALELLTISQVAKEHGQKLTIVNNFHLAMVIIETMIKSSPDERITEHMRTRILEIIAPK